MTHKSESRVTTSHWGAFRVLTRDLGTSRIGQGSSAHTTLVEITRLTE